jgi:hypothetical protein
MPARGDEAQDGGRGWCEVRGLACCACCALPEDCCFPKSRRDGLSSTRRSFVPAAPS